MANVDIAVKPDGWQLLNALTTVSTSKAADFRSKAARCSLVPLIEYIADNAATFHLRDVAALLRGCAVFHALRVDHLLRDVERELSKFFTIVERLGRATVVDKSMTAPYASITFTVDDNDRDGDVELDEYAELVAADAPIQGLVVPFDPYYDDSVASAADTSALFDFVADTSPESRPDAALYDATQESASRYVMDPTPRAPKVSPDEALVQRLSYADAATLGTALGNDDDDDMDTLLQDERSPAFAKGSARRGSSTSFRSSAGGALHGAHQQASGAHSPSPDAMSAMSGVEPFPDSDGGHDDHFGDNDDGTNDDDDEAVGGHTRAVGDNSPSPTPAVVLNKANGQQTPLGVQQWGVGVSNASPMSPSSPSSLVDFEGNVLPELEPAPASPPKAHSPRRGRVTFDAETELPGDFDDDFDVDDDDSDRVLRVFARPSPGDKPRLVRRFRFLTRASERMRQLKNLDYLEEEHPRVFQTHGLHNGKAERLWKDALATILETEDPDALLPVGAETDAEYTDTAGEQTAGEQTDVEPMDGASAAAEGIELGRRQSRGRLPTFSPSSFDSSNETSFEDTRRAQMPWATPRLSELAAASSSPMSAGRGSDVGLAGNSDDNDAAADVSRMADLSIIEVSAESESALGGADMALSLEAKQFFWHIVDYASEADDGAKTTLSDVIATRATKTVAVCAVGNLLALASAGVVNIEQGSPFGEVNITVHPSTLVVTEKEVGAGPLDDDE